MVALLNGSDALIVSTKLASELKKLWLVMRNPRVKHIADSRRWSSAVLLLLLEDLDWLLL